jgi:hypothetical protein
MPFDFDPDAFLDGMRKDRTVSAKVAKDAETMSNFSTFSTLAGATPESDMASAPNFSRFSTLARHTPDTAWALSDSVAAKAAKDTKPTYTHIYSNTNNTKVFKNGVCLPLDGVGAVGVPSAKALNILKFEIHPQLRAALARELLWQVEEGRPFLIDVSVRAKMPLLEQVPSKIDSVRWRSAVIHLSDCFAGRVISRNYENQPIITIGPSIWVSLGREASK